MWNQYKNKPRGAVVKRLHIGNNYLAVLLLDSEECILWEELNTKMTKNHLLHYRIHKPLLKNMSLLIHRSKKVMDRSPRHRHTHTYI